MFLLFIVSRLYSHESGPFSITLNVPGRNEFELDTTSDHF